MLAYLRYSLTIKLVGNKLVRKPKNFAPFWPPREIQFDFKTWGFFEVRRRNYQWPGAADALKWNDENNPKPSLGAPPDPRIRTRPKISRGPPSPLNTLLKNVPVLSEASWNKPVDRVLLGVSYAWWF